MLATPAAAASRGAAQHHPNPNPSPDPNPDPHTNQVQLAYPAPTQRSRQLHTRAALIRDQASARLPITRSLRVQALAGGGRLRLLSHLAGTAPQALRHPAP
eukprot:scaffold2790_cov56-Phaeocystis_antarctica.AAC.6